MRLRFVISTAFFSALLSFSACVAPAVAAVCDRGKPVVARTPLGDAYCQCFDKDPAGTQVFTLEFLLINVTTPGSTFSQNFSWDANVTCDADHLYVVDEESRDRHAFPLRSTSVELGAGGEIPVKPEDQPNLEMIRLVFLGHARYVKTI